MGVRGTITDAIEDLRCNLLFRFNGVSLGSGSAPVPMCLTECSTHIDENN